MNDKLLFKLTIADHWSVALKLESAERWGWFGGLSFLGMAALAIGRFRLQFEWPAEFFIADENEFQNI